MSTKDKYILSLEERVKSAVLLAQTQIQKSELTASLFRLAVAAKQLRETLGSRAESVARTQLSPESTAILGDLRAGAGVAPAEPDEAALGNRHSPAPSAATQATATNTLTEAVAGPKQSQPPLLTPWHLVLRKLYPGQISSLRQHHRNLIDAAVHEQFLIPNLGTDKAAACLVQSGVSSAYYGVPNELLDEFNGWFTEKMDELVQSEEFSMKNSRRKAVPSASLPAQQQPENTPFTNNLLQQQSNLRQYKLHEEYVSDPGLRDVLQQVSPLLPDSELSGPSLSQHQPKSRKLSVSTTNNMLKFDQPPLPTFPDGSPNPLGYRNWTDVIRAKYPTFNKSGSHMCRIASQYAEKIKLKKIPMRALSALRANKYAFGIPQNNQQDFLAYMESVFLQPNGQFGPPSAHYPVQNPQEFDQAVGSSSEEDENYEEISQQDQSDGGYYNKITTTAVNSTTTAIENKNNSNTNNENVSSISRNTRRSSRRASSVTPTTGPTNLENATSVLAWQDLLSIEQKEYFTQRAHDSRWLFGVWKRVTTYLEGKSGGGVEREVEFQEWFDEQIKNGFEDATPDVHNVRGDEETRLRSLDGGVILDGQSRGRVVRGRSESPSQIRTRKLVRRSPGVDSERGKRMKVSSGEIGEAGGDEERLDVEGDHSREFVGDVLFSSGEDAGFSTLKNHGGDIIDVKQPVVDAKSLEFVSKAGLKMIKYTDLVMKVMPRYKKLSRDARVAIKKAVKLFLQQEMKDDFEECVYLPVGAEHNTYGVPERLIEPFRKWAAVELAKAFPNMEIVKS